MDLEQKKKELQNERFNLLDRLETLDKNILKYDNLTPITTPELYKELSFFTDLKNKFKKYIGLETGQGKYEYILGGDGRSRPWSEERVGVVCRIETSYYLSQDQKELVKSYFKNIGKIDHIEIIII